MGYFGYKFIGKSPEIDATRRSILDSNANLAQLSQFIIILAIPIIKHLAALLFNIVQSKSSLNKNFEDVNSKQMSSQHNKRLKLSYTTQRLESAMGREIRKGFGTYEQWIFGFIWAVWLGFLCIKNTSPG